MLCDTPRAAMLRADVPRIVIDDAFAALLDAGDFTAVEAEHGEPALFLYTSGSTGRPKGVVLSHQSHLWVLAMRATPAPPPGQRVLVAAPLYHMNALSMCQVTLNNGGTIVLLPSFNAATYIDAASRYQVHALTGVPTMIAMMLREHAAMAAADFSSVQSVRIGSAPLSEQLIAQMRQALPHARILHGYGTTEAGPVVFASQDHAPLSVGVAHPAVDLRLMRDGVEVMDEGVLEMRCPAVMNGYHKLPDATRKRDHAGRLLHHRRRVPPRRRRVFLFCRPRGRHVRLRRREHLSRRGGEDAGAASRRASGLRRAGSR